MTRLGKGDRLVAFKDDRPCRRLYIEVTRVARDGTWADIRVSTWAVMWTKRQKLDARALPPHADLCDWSLDDLIAQEDDHIAMLAETIASEIEDRP
jgi:hypothetical protein